jgi:y4mF family transcriptional regulator
MLFSRSVKLLETPILTPAEIGSLIRTTRKAQGMRQDQLAGAAGVGLRFVVDLEAGKPTVQVGKTLMVLQALGCSVAIAPPPDR